jgi:hypothetical protein
MPRFQCAPSPHIGALCHLLQSSIKIFKHSNFIHTQLTLPAQKSHTHSLLPLLLFYLHLLPLLHNRPMFALLSCPPPIVVIVVVIADIVIVVVVVVYGAITVAVALALTIDFNNFATIAVIDIKCNWGAVVILLLLASGRRTSSQRSSSNFLAGKKRFLNKIFYV